MSSLKRKPIDYIGTVLRFVLLAAYLVVVLFPFFWILSTSLKGSQAEIYAYPVIYWPEHPSLKNFADIIRIGNFGNYFLNSFLTAGIGATGAVLVSVYPDDTDFYQPCAVVSNAFSGGSVQQQNWLVSCLYELHDTVFHRKPQGIFPGNSIFSGGGGNH